MQEARGTARALRQEVGQLHTTQVTTSEQPPPVETMLDALDGAIEMMSLIESPTNLAPGYSKERRGRIDVATLLFDIAPNAKLSIEPGAGTEVFGVEQELRRMLNLLVKLSSSDGDSPSAISVHRETDWVVVSVGLGPEGMATRDLEHRWLNRMALRHGGRVELTGNEIKLYLPADAESGQQELQQLRKELEQAQQLGAVYAKELAEAFTSATGDSVLPVPVTGSQLAAETRLQVFVACASSVARSLRQTTESLKGDINRLSRVIGEQHELVQALVTRQIAYGELVTDLDRIGRITLDESAKPVDIAELLRDTVDAASGRAQRQDISLTVYAEGTFTLTTRASVMGVLLRSLVEQAVQSSPRRTDISVTLCRENTVDAKHYVVRIVDGGPLVPDAAISGLLQGTADPSAIGRPSALNWLTIGTTAQVLGLSIETGMSTNQRSEIRLCTS